MIRWWRLRQFVKWCFDAVLMITVRSRRYLAIFSTIEQNLPDHDYQLLPVGLFPVSSSSIFVVPPFLHYLSTLPPFASHGDTYHRDHKARRNQYYHVFA